MAVAAFVAYNFIVFKEIRACYSDSNVTDTNFSCTDQEQCISEIKRQAGMELNEDLPAVIKDNFEMSLEKMVSCSGTCRIKSARLIESGECGTGEDSVTVKLHGKELLQMYSYIKKTGQSLNSIGNFGN